MNKQSFRFTVLLILLTLAVEALIAQQSGVLDQYVEAGLAHNRSLRQSGIQLDKSKLALEEAKRLFYPEVGFGTSYTRAAGGRKIEIPVGTLMNPVYATLNQLTQSNVFPQISNVEEQFLPDNFYDARIRVRQPVLNAEIQYNRRIKAAQISIQEVEMQVMRRELTKEIQVAYFRYLQALEPVKILQNALFLLEENKKLNESLVRNNKVIPSVITRINSEQAMVQGQLAQARLQARNAAAYFNHLTGRNLDDNIQIDSVFILQEPATVAAGPGRREELDQLRLAADVNQLVVDLQAAQRRPQVGAQLDAGSQNFDFKWGGYALLGISLEVPLWTAGRNNLKVQQAQLDGLALQEQTRQVEELIRLEIETARNALAAERETWQSYQLQLSGAKTYYRETIRRYQEGMANNLEVLDARTQLTNLEIQSAIARFNVWIRKTELERALAAI